MFIKKRKLQIRIKKIDIEEKLLLLWLCIPFVLTLERFILARIGLLAGITREIIFWGTASIPIILFVLNIGRIKLRQYNAFILLFLTVIFSMFITLLLNPNLEIYFTRATYGIERILRPDCALYAFLFFSIFENPEKLKKNLTIYAYLDFAYLVVLQLIPALIRGYWIDIGPSGREMHFSYNLSFGYAIAFPTMVFMMNTFKRRKIKDLILGLIGIWCVVTQGNRGALLVLVIFFGLTLISNVIGGNDTSKKLLKIICILIGIVLVIAFGNYILDIAISWLGKSGINSRTLEMILNGSISDDNGRDLIWGTIMSAIKKGGIFGYGMLGDRPFVFPYHVAGYSHNLFLELIVSYGIIGIGIIGYLVFITIRMIFFCKDNSWRELFIILFSSSCQLMLSMSFWYVWQFWATLAIAYRYIKLSKRKQRWGSTYEK